MKHLCAKYYRIQRYNHSKIKIEDTDTTDLITQRKTQQHTVELCRQCSDEEKSKQYLRSSFLE